MQTANPHPAFCVLSYFGLLALVPFFVKKNDPFLRWHASQGLLLVGVAVVLRPSASCCP